MSVNKYNSTTGNLDRLDGYTVDSTPTQNSGNPVSSGGVFTALAGKLNTDDKIVKRVKKTDIASVPIGNTGYGDIQSFSMIDGYTPFCSVIENWSDNGAIPYGSGLTVSNNNIHVWIFGPKNENALNLAVTVYYIKSDLLQTVTPS